MTSARARLAALLLGALLGLLPRPAAAAWIDYVLIEANEGGSSGGHAVLRFGDTTYHFQREQGVLRLVREDTRRLLFDYVLTGNRGARASRIEVTDETWSLLRARFEQRRLVQARQLALADALEREREILAQLASRADDPHVAIPGAGYLAPAPPDAASPALLALRDRIVEQRGPDFIGRLVGEVRARMRAMDPRATGNLPSEVTPDRMPPSVAIFAEDHLEAASLLAALTVLEEGAMLRAGTFRTATDDTPPLTPAERRALLIAARDLDVRLLSLVTAPRSGAGYPLLIGLARRAALERTLETGRLVHLDAYAPEGPRIERSSGLLEPHLLEPMLADAAVDLAKARKRLIASSSPGERQLARLEEMGNRHREIAGALRDGRPLRVQRHRLIPRLPATRPVPRPSGSETRIRRALADATRRERAWREALAEVHAYHLLSHNCVSALFDTVHSAFATNEIESTERLGGYVDPEAPLRFWPLVSAAAVRSRYRVGDEWRMPALRRLRVEEMARRENALRVSLRESNTLTSRAYTRSPADSFFVFFTDTEEALPLRPLLGTINLGASVVETGWGGVRAPFDRGRRLVSGLRGTLMSLAEIGFFSIRKGSHPYVDRDQIARVDAAVPR